MWLCCYVSSVCSLFVLFLFLYALVVLYAPCTILNIHMTCRLHGLSIAKMCICTAVGG